MVWNAAAQLTDLQLWASLVTLTAMEIVLGIDNLIFIALLAGRLPQPRADLARRLGLLLALVVRLALLSLITLIMRLTAPVLSVLGQDFSWRDLILLGGGLFLLYKGTVEIHERIEGDAEHRRADAKPPRFAAIVVQIVLIDIVFSIDSVITAVGMANQLGVMMAAVVISVIVMMVASGPVAGFINRHPTVKMLALSFLLLIGVMLVADGFGMHMPRAYVYAAIAFSAFVELLNHAARSYGAPASAAGRGQDEAAQPGQPGAPGGGPPPPAT